MARWLCLDGGGVRAISSMSFLRELEEDRKRVDPKFSLSTAFDGFAGTSSGSFSCIGIAILGMSAGDCLKHFQDEKARDVFDEPRINLRVFATKHDDGKLRATLERFMGDAKFRCDRPVLVPAYSLDRQELVAFDAQATQTDLACIDVAMASAAAPTFFPSAKVGSEWFVDGGICANNPVLEAIAHGAERVLSVGTGRYIPKVKGTETKRWGALQWVNAGLFDIMNDGDRDASIAQRLLGKKHLRVNSNIPEKESGLDDNSLLHIAQMVKIGKMWYRDHREEVWAWFGWSLGELPGND